MPIKLIQVQRKLNVGINTVVEFLRKKGFEVEDNNPNTRIGDEQYALLVKEFGKDLPNGGRERERVVPERSHREASSVKEEKSSEIKTVIPEEFRPKIVTKGRIDLDRPHKKVQEVQHQPVSVPVEKKVEKPVEAATAAKTADAPVEEVKTPEVKAPEVEIPEVKIPEMKQQPEEIKEEKVIVVEKEPAEVMKPEPGTFQHFIIQKNFPNCCSMHTIKFTIVNANMKAKTVAIIVFLHTETNTIESCSAENRLKLCLKNS